MIFSSINHLQIGIEELNQFLTGGKNSLFCITAGAIQSPAIDQQLGIKKQGPRMNLDLLLAVMIAKKFIFQNTMNSFVLRIDILGYNICLFSETW